MIGPARSFSITALLVSLLITLGSSIAQAGGGPENVFLVVNPQSVDSMTVANYYIKLRDIPDRNVFYLEWDPAEGLTNINIFRDKILLPILDEIKNRGLIGQIDYVVYSTDYPWGIEINQDINRFLAETKNQQSKAQKQTAEQLSQATEVDNQNSPNSQDLKPIEWPKILTKRGSLTGLTYLYQLVLTKQPIYYTNLMANHYMRPMKGKEQTVPTIAFSNRLRFDANGKPTNEMTGCKYLLSVALGITGTQDRRGNSVEEIIQYLERSVKADATFPQGIIYYDVNDDVRSTVRQPGFEAAIHALAELGVQAEIINKYPPKEAMNIMGLTLGTPAIDLKPWLRGIRPGAICDNLTSHAGNMGPKNSQTSITEFLKAGMAGASGTVLEPYAIPAKFPSPMIHVHYARGCSLAEAFYQSIYGPYQTLIVGEPLCKPWAEIPKVSVKMGMRGNASKLQEIQPNQAISGKLILYPSAELADNQKVHHFEVYLDGHLIGICLRRGVIPINTARLGDGYHELRVVAVAPQPVYTRGYKIVPIKTSNHNRSIEVEHTPAKEVRLGESILVEAKCPNATRIEIEHNSRTVGKIDGGNGQVKIDANELGKGPVTLQVVGILGNGAKNRVLGKPISVEVK